MPRIISKETQQSITGVKIASLNLSRTLLSSEDDTKKYTIQKALSDNLFKNYQVNAEIERGFSVEDFNSRVDLLKKSGSSFDKLFKMNGIHISGGQTGPGELLLYFLIDSCFLSQGQEIDVKIDKVPYEVKGVIPTSNKEYYGFTTGSKKSPELRSIENDLINLNKSIKPQANNYSVEVSDIKVMLTKVKDEFKSIEKKYQEEVYNSYFKNKKFIFISTRLGDKGHILHVGEIPADNIRIRRLSNSRIEPYIKL